jgi:hypothetical protein
VAPGRGGSQGWTRMLPDLRFLIGAVLATALLGVTVFGLAAAMHLSRQSKVAPLETSRLLAYTPDGGYRIVDVPARRFDNPFANIPPDPNPVPMQQSLRPAAEQEPAGDSETAAAPEPAGEPRAEPELAAAEPEPADAPPMQTAAAAQPASPPANDPAPANDPDTVDERAVVDPPLPQDGDAAAEAAPPPEPAPAPVTAAPVETMPAPPAPVVETPTPAAPPEVEDVGSIQPTNNNAETRSQPRATEDAPAAAATTETSEPKAKRKRAVRRAVVRRPPEQTTPINPFGFTLYPTPAPASTASTANRPAKGFWQD